MAERSGGGGDGGGGWRAQLNNAMVEWSDGGVSSCSTQLRVLFACVTGSKKSDIHFQLISPLIANKESERN